MAQDEVGQRAYREFCSVHTVSLSFQPWWWDAVCGPDGWGAAVVETGVWPYFRTRRWGVPVATMPPYTTYSGPFLAPFSAQWPTWRRLQWEQRTLERLAERLPSGCFFRQNCLPEFDYGLPLLWAGFRLSTRYTYVFPAGCRTGEIYSNLKHALRTDLRRAQREVWVEPTWDAGRLFALYVGSLHRRGLRRPYAPFKRLLSALRQRGRGVGWVARCRRDGADIAGLLLAFDERQGAVVMAGRAHRQGYPGALHRLYWEAIGFCCAHGLALDFEGSMLTGVERVFRAFGALQRPYLQVSRFFKKSLCRR